MKILVISNLYEPYARGGAEVIVKRTIEEMIRQGHQVTLITAKPFSGFSSLRPQMESQDSLRIWRFYPLNVFFYAHDGKWPLPLRLIWHAFDLFNLHSAFLAAKLLKQEQPDLVITHNLMGLGYVMVPLILKSKVRHIHILHDIQLAVRSGLMKRGEEGAWFVSGLTARIYQRMVKKFFGSPDRVISPSAFLKNFYAQRGYFPSTKMEVLRNPIDPRFFQTMLEHQATEEIRFAYVGQLAEHKGIKTLLAAFESMAGASLHIAGDGPCRKLVEAAASKNANVVYHGRLPNEALPAFFEEIDATILPTETYENSPTVVFESLACGRPVIVSRIGGAAEPVKEGENGFTFEPGNIDELKKKITEMMGKHHLMREAARQSVQPYQQSEYVRKLLSLET